MSWHQEESMWQFSYFTLSSLCQLRTVFSYGVTESCGHRVPLQNTGYSCCLLSDSAGVDFYKISKQLLENN